MATLAPARVLRSDPTAIRNAIRATNAAPAARPAATVTRRLSRLTDHSTTIVDSRLILGTWAIQPVPCGVSVSASGSIAAWTAATIATQAITARLRDTHSSHSASGATRNAAKKCVITASDEHAVHHARVRPVWFSRARLNHKNEAPLSAARSMYARASCEYQT